MDLNIHNHLNSTQYHLKLFVNWKSAFHVYKGSMSSTQFAMLHHNVPTVAQSGQTKHLRGSLDKMRGNQIFEICTHH